MIVNRPQSDPFSCFGDLLDSSVQAHSVAHLGIGGRLEPAAGGGGGPSGEGPRSAREPSSCASGEGGGMHCPGPKAGPGPAAVAVPGTDERSEVPPVRR